MLDVHMPHPTHTWKDFFIHIATIMVGLLIAIGLEQTVEYFHREHQRHVLEENLHQEGVESQEIARRDVDFLDAGMSLLAEDVRLADVELAARGHRAARFSPVHTQQPDIFTIPPQAVWTSARESGLTALLPRELHRSYTRLYLQFDLAQRYELDRRDARSERNGFVCLFGDGNLPCKPDLAAMSVDELKEYQVLSMKVFTRYQAVKDRLLSLMSMNQIILDGATITETSTAGNPSIESYRRSVSQHPDKFLNPAAPAKKP